MNWLNAVSNKKQLCCYFLDTSLKNENDAALCLEKTKSPFWTKLNVKPLTTNSEVGEPANIAGAYKDIISPLIKRE